MEQTPTELRLDLPSPDPVRCPPGWIGGKSWGEWNSKKKVIALHGRLDNAASYDGLGVEFAKEGYHLVALDFPGHGNSMWNSDGVYTVGGWAMNIMQALDILGWDRCLMIAHSAGQGIATIAAGMVPDRFVGCILIDGFGMWTHSFDQSTGKVISSDQMSRYFRQGYKSLAKLGKKSDAAATKRYASLEAAIKARQIAVTKFPGNQTLKRFSAEALVRRGSAVDPTGTVRFTHDVRANNFGNMQVLSEEQSFSFLTRLPPTLVLLCELGFPDSKRGAFSYYKKLGRSKRGNSYVSIEEIPNTSHHLHLDEPVSIAAKMFAWIEHCGLWSKCELGVAPLPSEDIASQANEFLAGSKL